MSQGIQQHRPGGEVGVMLQFPFSFSLIHLIRSMEFSRQGFFALGAAVTPAGQNTSGHGSGGGKEVSLLVIP